MMNNKKKSPTCAVILIGNELLSGRTVDSNFNMIACQMKNLGIVMKECRIIGDYQNTIIQTLNELRQKYTYIFTTGGIGPTHDDITTASVAKAFGVDIRRDEKTVEEFKAHYKDKLKEATLKMADFPEGADLIPNPLSIAPGFRLENVFCFAGVPSVAKVMLEAVVPLLMRGDEIYTRSIDVFLRESEISLAFEDIQNKFVDVELGSYPFKIGNRVGTSLVGQGTNKSSLDASFEHIQTLIQDLNGEIR